MDENRRSTCHTMSNVPAIVGNIAEYPTRFSQNGLSVMSCPAGPCWNEPSVRSTFDRDTIKVVLQAREAEAQDRRARALVRATWALAFATVALIVATIAPLFRACS